MPPVDGRWPRRRGRLVGRRGRSQRSEWLLGWAIWLAGRCSSSASRSPGADRAEGSAPWVVRPLPGGRRPARAWRDGRAVRAVVVAACGLCWRWRAQRTRTPPTRARPSSSSPSATHPSYVRSPTPGVRAPASPGRGRPRAPDRVGLLRATAGPAVADHRAHLADAWDLYRGHPLPFLGIGGGGAHQRRGQPRRPARRRPPGTTGGHAATQTSPWAASPGRGAADDGVLAGRHGRLLGRARRRTPVGPSAPTGSPLRRTWPLLGAGLLWLAAVLLPLVVVVLAPLSLVAFVAFVRYVPAVQIEGAGARRAAPRTPAPPPGRQTVLVPLLATLIALVGGLLGIVIPGRPGAVRGRQPDPRGRAGPCCHRSPR